MKGLKRCREAAGLSQPQLAAALGLTRMAVSAWETGTALPQADKLPAIARVLGCSIDELFREVTDCHGPKGGPRNDKDTKIEEARP
ncbi:MAG: helix-turn-helix transcriptional regulator [Clostridia bacterium]|nr:helix-turn-helix transcriptional regulator [Clostridia bacterium]